MKCSRDILNALWGGYGLENLLISEKYDNTPIYRHVKLVHFLQMLEERQNVLTHPSSWDDPFEGVIFNSKYVDEDNNVIRSDSAYSRFYGQCWTFNDADTELQWKSHSADGYGVCLGTTVKRIKEALIGLDELENPPACVIGGIQYKKLSAIRRIVEDMSRRHDPNAKIGRVTENGLISFLFLKREEYQDEKELRIIVNIGGDNTPLGRFQKTLHGANKYGLVKYDVDPKSFLKVVILDPRMPTSIADFVRLRVKQTEWGLNVAQSDLYTYFNDTKPIRVYKD